MNTAPLSPLSYRQEVTTLLFERVKATESCVIVSMASMGKSRLVRFMLRPEVQKIYLNEVDDFLLIHVDCNRIVEKSEWGMYELLMTSILEGCLNHQTAYSRYYKEFNHWRNVVLKDKNAYLALRNLELAIRILVEKENFKICFLIDEFDELYKILPATSFSNFRGIRDANKNNLSFVIFMRNHPESLRPLSEQEQFYELFSHFVYGLPPYSPYDAQEMMNTLEIRRQQHLEPVLKNSIYQLSGGHPGTIMALFRIVEINPQWILNHEIDKIITEPTIIEECNKLLDSLTLEEKKSFVKILRGEEELGTRFNYLVLKGVLNREGKPSIPIFQHFFKRKCLTSELN